MYLSRLVLRDFRNIKQLELDGLEEGIYILIGQNAMGKTNLIEAINYLSCGRSFRGAKEAQLVREGSQFAGVTAGYQGEIVSGKVEAFLLRNGQKSIKINGSPVRRISELMGVINSVVFAPEDLRTIKESPSLRRRLMDVELSKMQPTYYMELQQYLSVLKQKNKLLKSYHLDELLLETYNESLITYALPLIQKRMKFLQELNLYAKECYTHLTGGKEELSVTYQSTVELPATEGMLQEKLAALSVRERELRLSLVGPHREDMVIRINGQDVKQYASQGQQRTAMLAIKLACTRIAHKMTGEKPILLLDDVFSELDQNRRTALLELVANQQVFITATDATRIQMAHIKWAYRVVDGEISQLSDENTPHIS